MKQTFNWIQQPPESEKINCLVDEFWPNNAFGITHDIDKIHYNIDLMGEQNKVGMKNFLRSSPTGGGSTIFPWGRYVIYLQMNSEETQGYMWFADHKYAYSQEEMREIFATMAKGSTLDEKKEQWISVQMALKKKFDPEIHDYINLVQVSMISQN